MRLSFFRLIYDKMPREYDVEAFFLWAFGEGYDDLEDPLDVMKAWNCLHGDKYLLTRDGCIDTDLKKMVDVWVSCSTKKCLKKR